MYSNTEKKRHVHSNQIGLATIPYRKLGSFGCGYILVYLAHSMKAPKLNTPKNHMHQSKFRVGLDDKRDITCNYPLANEVAKGYSNATVLLL